MAETLLDHLIDIKQTLAGQNEKLDALERAVLGNGQPGLTQRVETLEGAKNRLWGAGAVVTFLAGLAEFFRIRGGR